MNFQCVMVKGGKCGAVHLHGGMGWIEWVREFLVWEMTGNVADKLKGGLG